ncbi:MAG: DUF2019 domain-containing protein [Bacteroidia bacterium]|nr:DUF2019 domain-containing protein [Bacteroidia bacterium]
MKLKDKESALMNFETAASKHAEAAELGDYKIANKNQAVIEKVVNFLKGRNELKSLSQFLNHSSDGVKGWAATYLLPIEERQAIRALEEIAKGSGIRSLAAETTLSEWRKGNLKL